ncbi:DUF4365 domain-containing protein [Streptomyces sp. NBC_00073]|uniref:DUF4365 domain-containing protein n=1 Tax=Streptomyces sp. NBC_00073 TaxID=2975640 RepID=UPI00324E5534
MLPTKQTERAAVNATRAFLEAHECVVQEVDTGNDYGKDLLVDLTEDLEITGESIAIQVKGGSSFCRSGKWGIPAKSTDLRLWLESSIPIFGMVHDPATGNLHWMNLSAYVREEMRALYEFGRASKQVNQSANDLPGHFVIFPEHQALSHDSWPRFRHAARAYLERFAGHSLLNLMDSDPDKQESAVADCFALGRGDARALLLVRQLIERLSGPSLHTAIQVLSHCIPHPDIFWHRGNWIPQHVKESVSSSFSWNPHEIYHMIQEVNAIDEPGKWGRGTLGQSLLLMLLADGDISIKIPDAVRIACAADETEVAALMLYVYQYQRTSDSVPGKDVLDELKKIAADNPKIVNDRYMHDLISAVADNGWVDIF